MLEMNLDVHNGFVVINNHPLQLKDVDTFKHSVFYKSFSPFTSIGPFISLSIILNGKIKFSFWN